MNSKQKILLIGIAVGVLPALVFSNLQIITDRISAITEIPTDDLFAKGEEVRMQCPGLGYLTSPKGGESVVFKCDWEGHDTWDMVTDTTLAPNHEILALSANPHKSQKTLTVVKKYQGDDQWRIIEVWEEDWSKLAKSGGSCLSTKMGQCDHHKLAWKRKDK